MPFHIFKQGNWKEAKRLCVVCNSAKDGEVVLIPIDDKVYGNNAEAVQVHLSCLSLWFNEKRNFIYQKCNQNIEEQEIAV
jgi:hypothetical protein